MTPGARKLLGGYATNTLTESEQKLLFETALSDQDLFNALAGEQALKHYLDDHEFRGELREALEEAGSSGPAGNLVAGSFPQSPIMARARYRSPVPPAPRTNQPLGWIFAATVALTTLIIFTLTFHPPRPQIAKFTPPPAAPAIPPDPPPPLPQRAAPAAVLPALAAIKTPAPLLPSRRLKVAVLNFNSGAKKPELGRSASNFVSDQLQSDKIYTVIDRKVVRNAFPADTAPANPAVAARQGRQLGADAVVLGQIDSAPATMSASLIDSNTGRTLRAAQAPASPQTMQAAAKALGAALEAEGKVTDVNATILTVDLGTKAGIKPGSKLTISRDGKPLGSMVVTAASERFSVGNYSGQEPKIGDRAAVQ